MFGARVLIPNMLRRYKRYSKKSAIIITSSGLGSKPIPGFLAYSSTKSFANFLAQGLNYELKDKIDVISYQPGEVKTKMTARMKQNFRFIDADKAVSACFRDVGSEPLTYGAARHEVGMFGLEMTPFSYI